MSRNFLFSCPISGTLTVYIVKGKILEEGGEHEMKKLLCMCLTIAIVLSTSVCSFGSEDSRGLIEPKYESPNSAYATIGISSGKVSYEAKLKPGAGQNISYVKATLNLVNSNGTVIKSKTDTIYQSGGYFMIADSKTLTAKGTYHAEYTLKVYKSGSLVETIKGKSGNVTY